MANVILRNKNGFLGTLTPNYRKYTRPEEWIDLPTLVDGDEAIHMLVKVYEHSNYLAVDVDGDYQVDWGDGNVTTHTSGTQANWDIQWSGVSSTTLTSGGYKQAIVSITPQSGSSLTRIEMNGTTIKHPDDQTNYNPQVVDIRMAGQNFTSFASSFYFCEGLEQFEFVGSAPVLTNLSNMFAFCKNLKKVVQFDTSNVTSFNSTHRYCSSLLEIPKYDLSSATNVQTFFNECNKIQYIEPWDLDNDAPNITSIQSMFAGCDNLSNLPITSCNNITNFTSAFEGVKMTKFDLPVPNATNVSNMFQNCSDLIEVTSQFPSGITKTTYMFDQCSSLKTVQPFDTSQVTSSEFMFRSTFNLTDVSSFNFSASTDLAYMFISSDVENLPQGLGGGDLNYFAQGLTNIRKYPDFNQPITKLFRAFASNYSLELLPNMDVSSLTDIRSAFLDCRALKSFPSWNLSAVTLSDVGCFQYCRSLRESNISGLTRTHGYRYSQLDRDAIVNIFNNLGTAAGTQTIYVNNTPGAANLTAGDIAIATGKGWTVVS